MIPAVVIPIPLPAIINQYMCTFTFASNICTYMSLQGNTTVLLPLVGSMDKYNQLKLIEAIQFGSFGLKGATTRRP